MNWVKTIQKKKSCCEATLGATVVLKNFTEITGKLPRWSLFLIKLQGYGKLFAGACFSNLLEPSMIFGPVKKI